MKFVLVGESGCGKNTILDYIRDKYNLNEIKSHTTRKPRSENDNGYIFSNFIEFEKYKINGEVFEHTNFANNFYWTTKEDFNHEDWVIIVDPVGVFNLKKSFNCKVVYINTDYNIRMKRLENNERLNRNLHSFDAFPCDYILNNNYEIDHTFKLIDEMMEFLWR